ncbi:lysozyme family protein [Pedobacter sp. UYP30]|uniref:hypothetical protein n=1 Tax=Pedobacter sp. UYP30 TaxID=1756400 RepID=UPI003392E139
MPKKRKLIKKTAPTVKKKQSSIPTATEYIDLFNTCVINKEKVAEVDKVIDENVVVNRNRYQDVSNLVSGNNAQTSSPLFQSAYVPFYDRLSMPKSTGFISPSAFKSPADRVLSQFLPSTFSTPFSKNNLFDTDVFGINAMLLGLEIPWYFIACIHYLECSFSFKKHLHNGDPLSGYTVHVPAHRPKVGQGPPFTFEESAVDALKLMKYDTVTNWSLSFILQKLEGYNGFGYSKRGVNSPYLWSYSNNYVKGKYVKDGVYDANAVSKQLGAAVILKRMEERALISIPRI